MAVWERCGSRKDAVSGAEVLNRRTASVVLGRIRSTHIFFDDSNVFLK